MMLRPTSWSRKSKAFAAVFLVLLMWAPSGVSVEQLPVVTGHSTFFNGDVYDRCLASVAGILRSRVMWFNDMVLTETYGGKGTFVYITEDGAPDPTKQNVLLSEGVFFDFVDPNGARWHVEEAYMDYGGSTTYPGPNNVQDWTADTIRDAGKPVEKQRYYVWFVELSERPVYDQFAPPMGDANYHTFYNFLVLVDTCKFNNNTATRRALEWHTGLEAGHPVGELDHKHESWNANVWVGTRPVVVPGGVSNQTASWQSNWAAEGGAQRDSGRFVNATTP